MHHKGTYYRLIGILELLKYLHDVGIYEKVCGLYSELAEEDYYEIVLNSMSAIAPVSDNFQIMQDENGEWDVVDGTAEDDMGCYNDVYTFSSPDMREYYMLCRLYDLLHGTTPEDNPYAVEAARWYSYCVNMNCNSYYFAAAFSPEDGYPENLWFEFDTENYYPEAGVIYCVHDTLQFYSDNIAELRLKLLAGGMPCFARLPEKGAEYVKDSI